eukprot:5182825-Prymnesium_polylepis.1
MLPPRAGTTPFSAEKTKTPGSSAGASAAAAAAAAAARLEEESAAGLGAGMCDSDQAASTSEGLKRPSSSSRSASMWQRLKTSDGSESSRKGDVITATSGNVCTVPLEKVIVRTASVVVRCITCGSWSMASRTSAVRSVLSVELDETTERESSSSCEPSPCLRRRRGGM